ncbi:MAG: DivIVA domain-containing protein [Bacilli bacterium]|nr:DivIVA domain-containing protein [Bacilli bacterium]
MEKFNRTLRGYDPEEVNAFLDQVINQVEKMVAELKSKDQQIASLRYLEKENAALRERLGQYEHMEGTLNRAIMMAQKTSDQMKVAAHRESEVILEDAKKNASRIVNEALLRAEKTEQEASQLRRNMTVFKRRLREVIENQLEMVNDIDQIEF